jgi:hypothetical protein
MLTLYILLALVASAVAAFICLAEQDRLARAPATVSARRPLMDRVEEHHG